MRISNLSELFWKKVRYVLLFLLSTVILYIVSVRYVFVIPYSDNADLLNSIKHYEDVLDQQKEKKEAITNIFKDIF